MFILANPLGLLALLGIPAVLAIHFLQRKARELRVSTLFLLERTQRDAASGRRLDRLIPSVPLWMQLLAVLLLTWFLAEPRYQRAESVQRVAVVLDSSASMSVFKEAAIERLKEALPPLKGAASNMEITVLESQPNRPRLYAGTSIEELGQALSSWQPRDGLVDPAQALRLARSLVSREGTVVYLTDTAVEALPFEARLLAVGEAIENVGFTGVSFGMEEGSLVWRALVRNYGTTPAERMWTMETAAGRTTPRALRIEPGALVTLQAAFPADAEHVRIVLTADRFPLDDVLPLVRPQPKPLALFTATSPAHADLTERLLRALDAAEPTNDAASADLSITSYDPLDPVLPPGNSFVFVADSTQAGAYLRGGIIAEPHPLMDGLNWQSLLIRETIELDRRPTDQVLLWQDERPLVFLREVAGDETRGAARQLCFNFDLKLSNADLQPAFIVLLHRFAESIRQAKIAAVAANLETGQPLRVTAAPELPLTLVHRAADGRELAKFESPPTAVLRAPLDPGYFTIHQGDSLLMEAALYFADTREADFSECGSSAAIEAAAPGELAIARHTRPDPYWRLALLVLIAALLASWKFSAPSPLPT